MHFNSKQLETLKEYRPKQRAEKSLMQAAIAIILRDGDDGLEFLLMQRAKHEDDPWSGQMSFPGGKIESDDASAKAAAIRETAEEVGIGLHEDDYLGQLDDLYGLKVDDRYSVHVASFIFMPKHKLAPVGNYEVEDLIWVPFKFLDDQSNAIDFYHPHSAETRMPAVLINAQKEQILWGLSLRIVSMLYALLGWSMGVLSKQDLSAIAKIEKRKLDSSKLSKKTQERLTRRG